MQIIISPAKTLDFETPAISNIHTQPQFAENAQILVNILKKYTKLEISNLMKLSDNLANINVERYKNWQLPFTPKTAKQALFAFKGDVYTGLDAETLSEDDLNFAQQHLRILSGLYGLLRPLDLIMPYRLEMGKGIKTQAGTNLYHFWGEQLTNALNNNAKGQGALINLASNEYFKAVKPKTLTANIITPVFKDKKNGQYKVISFFAKKARGMMVRYIIDNRITTPQNIKDFKSGGYYFSLEQSTQNNWVFLREEQSANK